MVPVPVVLAPLQPAIPAARHANRSAPAEVYAKRLVIGRRFRLRKNRMSRSPAKTAIGPKGAVGLRLSGPLRGIKCDSAVVKVAVHVPGVVLVPAVGVQVAAAPRAVLLFMN